MRASAFFKSIFAPSLRTASGLRRYMACVTAACVGVTLGIDIVVQLVFFVDWPTAARSWSVTIIEGIGLAAPISFMIGEAHLELYHAKQAAERASRIDYLTNLPNRRALMESVAELHGVPYALVIADIDNFKRINDTFGHLVGDQVIAAVSQVMARELADLGALARLGGEEFALVAPNAPADAVASRLEALRDRLVNVVADRRSARVTVSFGVAVARPNENFERIYASADRALYVAKARGRDRVVFSDQIEALAERTPGDERPARRSA